MTALTAASTGAAPVDLINPYRFQPAIAPHLAAELAGETIFLRGIRDAYVALAARADRVARMLECVGAGHRSTSGHR